MEAATAAISAVDSTGGDELNGAGGGGLRGVDFAATRLGMAFAVVCKFSGVDFTV